MLFSIFVCALYFGVWYAICYFPGEANTEIREYIREEFRETFGNDSMDFNMLAALYSEGSDETKLRSWLAVLLWTSVSTISIIMFVAMAITASCTKKKYSLHRTFTDSDAIEEDDEEHKQKDIKAPIRPASSSCCPNGHPHCYQLLSLYSLLWSFHLKVGYRGFDYVEATALGVFAFVDPVAITLCLPIFRKRIFSLCHHSTTAGKSSSDHGTY
ncbi:unnamed protein product [Caenorhabditis nigoni]